LDPKSFSNLLGYRGELLQEFYEIIKLTKDATWKEDGSRERLKGLAFFDRKIIKKLYSYVQKDIEKHLKIARLSLDLLKYKPDNSNLDGWL